jgi:hypothetical protein
MIVFIVSFTSILLISLFIFQVKLSSDFFEEQDFSFYLERVSDLSLEKARKSRIYLTTFLLFTFFYLYFFIYRNSFNIVSLYSILVAVLFSFKFYYFQLRVMHIFKVKELKQTFPFYFKQLSYSLNVQPVNVALSMSLKSAPKVIKRDLEILSNEIIESPNSFVPYENFIIKFSHVDHIVYYMNSIYTLSDIASEAEGRKILQAFTSNITRHTLESRSVKISAITDMMQIIVSFPVLVLGYLIFNLLSIYLEVLL